MPVSNALVTITNSATAISTSNVDAADPVDIAVVGDGAWYAGGPSVSTANGIYVAANERFTATLRAGDKLYGIRAGGTDVTARVMKNRS